MRVKPSSAQEGLLKQCVAVGRDVTFPMQGAWGLSGGTHGMKDHLMAEACWLLGNGQHHT